MMDFYLEWYKKMPDIEENKKYTKMFLSRKEESLKVFEKGTTEDLVFLCRFLLEIPISNFIYCIDEDKKCTTEMIVQFSNLNHAIIDLPRILKFNNNVRTYYQIGKVLVNAKREAACRKYGENHVKLASELSMVKLERKGAFEVTNTAFGEFSIGLSDNDRLELVRRLALRNEFIQKIIYNAKKGFVSYMDIALEYLSDSTAERRKSNVKNLVKLILKDNELFNNIVW